MGFAPTNFELCVQCSTKLCSDGDSFFVHFSSYLCAFCSLGALAVQACRLEIRAIKILLAGNKLQPLTKAQKNAEVCWDLYELLDRAEPC